MQIMSSRKHHASSGAETPPKKEKKIFARSKLRGHRISQELMLVKKGLVMLFVLIVIPILESLTADCMMSRDIVLLVKLCKENKFSIMMDESNDKGNDKCVAILVRVLDESVRKTETKFLAMPVCNIGTGANLFSGQQGFNVSMCNSFN